MNKSFINDIEQLALNNPETRAMLREDAEGTWHNLNWGQVWHRINDIALALLANGIHNQQNVAILASNSPEWTMTDIACQLANVVLVPLHAIGNPKDTAYILDHAAPAIVFCGSGKDYETICAMSPASVQQVVVFDPATALDGPIPAMHLDDFITISDSESLKIRLESRKRHRQSDDLFTIVYTSGTTGNPKGVMLTHANFDFQVEALERPTAQQQMGPDGISLCFLPLSHIYERQWNRIVLYYGYANAYLDKPQRFIEAAEVVQPQTFCSVPRIFEKIHAAIQDKIDASGPLTSTLVRHALKTGRQCNLRLKNGENLSAFSRMHFSLMDWLVLRRMRDILGGNVRNAPCGGAPLAANLQEFFCGLGITVRSGYGLTETCGSVSSQDPDDYGFGSTGKPMKGVEVRVGDEGELQLRGGNIMKGYYRDPQATAEAFTADGFFRTGDIGHLEANGEIRITDRLKDLMKTSGGKYIAPQPIEALFAGDSYIEKIAIIADQRDFVSALIEPNRAALLEYARQHNISFENYESLLANSGIRDLFQKQILARSANLARHEMIRAFALLPEPFSIEKGELTPSLKLKRKTIAERYQEIIDAMYTMKRNCAA